MTDDDKVKMNSFDRGRIQVLYVPATRDPARHLRHVAGSLIHPLLKAVQWSEATRETAEEAALDECRLLVAGAQLSYGLTV